MSMSENFNYIVEQFADLQLLRYRVAGFENLSFAAERIDLLPLRGRFGRKRYSF